MQRIVDKIERESLKLENSELCLWLRNNEASHEDRLSFTPSMLFFVLGFKDILNVMSTPNPKTEIEIELNIHCEEDLDHWKWYLQDLETMGFIPESWGGSMNNMFQQIWGDKNSDVRNFVYTIIHHVKKHNNPLISMVMIEYLEAAFAVFIRHIRVPINKMGLYEKLSYFGKIHVEKEESHSHGSWVDGQRSQTSGQINHTLDDSTFRQANLLLDELSVKMLQVFDTWYTTRNEFSRFMPQEVLGTLHKEKEETV